MTKLKKLRRKEWFKATMIRCIRTFITTILGVYTAGTMITEVNWKTTLLSAVSATVYIFLTCVVAGLPEVDDTKIYKRVIDDEGK